jgi:hypothetical protein
MFKSRKKKAEHIALVGIQKYDNPAGNLKRIGHLRKLLAEGSGRNKNVAILDVRKL